MRVVFLTHNYPRYPGDVAGGFLHPLARALAGRGLDVRVVAPSDAGRGGEDVLDGVPIRRVRYAPGALERLGYGGATTAGPRGPAMLLPLAGLWRALRRGARREARGARTVVHAHWWVPAGVAAPPELPLVLTVHGTDARLLLTSRPGRLAARAVFRRARVVTAVSSAAAGAVQPFLLPRREARVQPMPVETAGWGWSRGGGGVLVVSRLTEQKRVHLAVAAAATLAQNGIRVPVTIVGDGPMRSALEAGVALLKAEDVRFLGALPFDRVLALLSEADVALQLSHDEGFGLAAVEALMCGVPVVACRDGGGLLEIVPAEGAGRIAAPVPVDIAQAAAELLTSPDAKNAARSAGEGWRRKLEPAAVAARFHDWYLEAAGA